MQFTVSQDIIARPLQLVCSIVERRSTLPILSNILLRCRDQQLTMTSTDMELEMIATLPVAVEWLNILISTISAAVSPKLFV